MDKKGRVPLAREVARLRSQRAHSPVQKNGCFRREGILRQRDYASFRAGYICMCGITGRAGRLSTVKSPDRSCASVGEKRREDLYLFSTALADGAIFPSPKYPQRVVPIQTVHYPISQFQPPGHCSLRKPGNRDGSPAQVVNSTT